MTDLLLIPGAFHPLHYGHLGIADEAAALSGRTPTFLLTRAGTDLVQFGDRQVARDIVQIAGRAPVSFFELVARLPEAHYVIGATMLERELSKIGERVSAINRMTGRIYVAPRVVGHQLLRLEDVLDSFFKSGAVPYDVSFVPTGVFVPLSKIYDVTSSELRAARSMVSGSRS